MWQFGINYLLDKVQFAFNLYELDSDFAMYFRKASFAYPREKEREREKVNRVTGCYKKFIDF